MNPPRNRKGGAGNPPPTGARASALPDTLDLPSGAVEARGEKGPADTLLACIDGTEIKAAVVRDGAELHVMVRGATDVLALVDPVAAAASADGPAPGIVASLPGRIVKVLVKPGQSVKQGAALVIVEAMKMEHTFRAPVDGRVERIPYHLGDLVDEGAELVVFVPRQED